MDGILELKMRQRQTVESHVIVSTGSVSVGDALGSDIIDIAGSKSQDEPRKSTDELNQVVLAQ